MNKLVIIDLDGVIADSTARFAKAEEAKQKYVKNSVGIYETAMREAASLYVYWQTAFTPELVSLDTLIDGVSEAIEIIEKQGYHVLFLTSRPESMRQATVDWFWSLSPQVVLMSSDEWHDQLIMKCPAFQYTKTTVWKAGMVQTLASLYGASEVLVVDDEEQNRVEIAKYERNYELAFACSMADALTVIHMP